MSFWLVPPALALALLAAHFYRASAWPLMAASVVLIGLLACRCNWATVLVQIGLAAGTLEWLRTAYVLVQQRIAFGQPWGRLALILTLVALFTAISALVFRSERLRKPKPP